MKRTRTILFISAALFVLFSCKDTYLSEPHFPSGGGGERGIAAPKGLRASQGEKRSITLSWTEDPKAELYYIYSADSPLNTFIRCGETTSPQFKLNVPPGSTVYYRVSSVARDGTESTQSDYVRGTSLAQPFITDITDITEFSSSVTWYMDNVFENSYKKELLYIVYCFNGAAEVAKIGLNGGIISENRAVFTGLAPNTRYEYQVEAYLRGDQSASEKSEKMDAETARRFRPGAPVDLRASRGIAIGSITLSFELPDKVDIALGEGVYDPKPLYFVIYKRFYSESGNNEYDKKCSYFGSNAAKPGEHFTGYEAGTTVQWKDTDVRRGVKYEYLVQSYVDDTPKQITSDASKASAFGWALGEATLSFGKVEYTMGTALFTSAKLPLNFEFDPQNISYSYKLIEKIEPLGDDGDNDPDANITKEISLDSYDAVRAYIPTMDLTQKTTEDTPGRGIYSYAVNILLNNTVLDTISTLGKIEVSEDTDPIIVENFRVQDGYTDRFELKWDNYSNRKYTLYTVEANGNDPKEITSFNGTPSDDAGMTVIKNYSYSYTMGITTGLTHYFAIRPFRDIGGSFKPGQMVYAGIAAKTLGVPQASSGGDSTYSAITVAWTEAQKADTYRVKFRYEGDSTYKPVATVRKEALDVNAEGKFKYTFKPEGNEIAITKAGLEIEIQVDALNEGLRALVGGGEIYTSSKEEITTRLVGPALLKPSASKAASPQEITVKWNKITGAGGYYVFRRQFNMNNTAEEGTAAVVYYVPAVEASTVPITGKELLLDATNSKIDTLDVTASVTFGGGQYTLTDRYMTDGEYDGSYNRHTPVYRSQQNDMVQGCSYRYYVVPVISDSYTALSSIEFAYTKDGSNKNTNINYYTIQDGADIKYSGAASYEQEGFTIGFGQNVIATKGTYKSSGNINNGVRITWSAPPRLSSVSGFNPRYRVYRRESGGSVWETLKLDVNATEYIETQLVGTRGSAYEYAVGISGSGGISDPRISKRFIDKCYSQLDEKGRPKMLGFMLDQVKMEKVSRGEAEYAAVNAVYGERVKWKAAGIKHRDGVGNKWGIDGYEVYVMNRNIDADWHKIAEIPFANIPDEIDQSVDVTNVAGGNTLTGGLLKVMRDYRHFFKIRNYVLNEDNERIYSPDPNYAYKYYWKENERYLFETDYVKWGARQITATEFIKIAMVYMCDGIDQVNGTAWNSGVFGRSANADGDGTSGKVEVISNAGVTSWTFTFTDYKTDLQVRTGEWQHFLTINGKTWAGTKASNQYPQNWGDAGDIRIIGPTDTPGLYTGYIRIGGTGRGYRDMSWTGGDVSAKYPDGTADQKIEMKGEDTPMLYSGKGDRRYRQDAWK